MDLTALGSKVSCLPTLRAESRLAPGARVTPLTASAVWEAVVRSVTRSAERKVGASKRLPDFARTVFDPDARIPMEAVKTPDLAFWPPGHLGSGVALNETLMPGAERVRRSRMRERHAFEEFVSDMIPLERALPDSRDEWCAGEYGENDERPGAEERTSVIICFHNEVGILFNILEF